MPEPTRDDLTLKSDDELIAMEQDRSLPIERWSAVEAELGGRAEKRRSALPESPASRAASGMTPAGPTHVRERGVAELESLLVPGERLLAVAIQRRLFALVHRRITVGATTGRYIAITRGLFGGYTPYDVRWQDLDDASISAGIFGASLTISALQSDDLAARERAGQRTMVTGLRKEQAQQVYKICQAQEQAWREKRRIRDLTELRAESGGLHLGAMASGIGTTAPTIGGDPAERLRRAKQMLDDGLITDTEYESIKARVVDGL